MFAQIAEAYEVLSGKLRAVYDKFGEGASGPGRGRACTFRATRVESLKKFFGTSNPFATLLDGPFIPPILRVAGFGRVRRWAGKAPAVISTFVDAPRALHGVHKAPQNQSPPSTGGRTDAKRAEVPRGPRAARVARGHRVTFENEGDERAGVVPADVVFIVADGRTRCSAAWERSHLLRAHPARQRADGFSLRVDRLDGRVLNIPCNEVIRPGSVKTVSGEGMPISRQPGAREPRH